MKNTGYKKIIILILALIVFYLLYTKYFKKEKVEKPVTLKVKEDFINSNQIKDIKYSSKDLKGNEYILLAKEGEIDLNNSDIIFLKDVTANIKMIKKIKLLSNTGFVSKIAIASLAIGLYQFTRPYVFEESYYFNQTKREGRHQIINKYLNNFVKNHSKI